MATAEALLTAEEFEQMPDPGYPTELVRGRIVAMDPPGFRHGEICSNVVHLVRTYLDQHDRGRIVRNDSGTITERGPDTVAAWTWATTAMNACCGRSGRRAIPASLRTRCSR